MKEVEGREGSEEGKTGKVKEEKGTLGLTLTLKKSKKEALRSLCSDRGANRSLTHLRHTRSSLPHLHSHFTFPQTWMVQTVT